MGVVGFESVVDCIGCHQVTGGGIVVLLRLPRLLKTLHPPPLTAVSERDRQDAEMHASTVGTRHRVVASINRQSGVQTAACAVDDCAQPQCYSAIQKAPVRAQ